MVEVVEEEVEFAPDSKPRSLGDEAVVGRVELTREATKHRGDSQVELVVAIERGWIIHNCGMCSLFFLELSLYITHNLVPGWSLPHFLTIGLHATVTAVQSHHGTWQGHNTAVGAIVQTPRDHHTVYPDTTL